MNAVLHRWGRVLAVGLCGLLRLHGQSSDGTLTGTVLDVVGKGISAAVVSVRNESTGATRQLPAGSDGKFSVTGLPAGTYSIGASAPTFSRSRRTVVITAAGATDNVS